MQSVEIMLPGDKSISHRAVMIAAISNAPVIIHNLLFSEDVLATVNAMRALGVHIQLNSAKHEAIVHGVGLHGFHAPSAAIDCGNSGTTMRLLCGLLAGQSFDAKLIGDCSLMKRPMARVADPLRLMGASIVLSADNTAPIHIFGNHQLKGVTYAPPVASAQVKSAIMLAALYAKGETVVKEVIKTRDHTERMLDAFALGLTQIDVPGDISSAAFFIVLAAITPGSNVVLKSVGVNPCRIGIIDILNSMGANIRLKNQRHYGAEPVADIEICYAPLQGICIPKEFIVSAIDEFPAIFIAAVFANGVTTLRNAKELRVKETDRIAAMAEGLQAVGVSVEVFEDGLSVEGAQTFKPATIDSFGDHRIAMAFSILAKRTGVSISIENIACIATSFPGFLKQIAET